MVVKVEGGGGCGSSGSGDNCGGSREMVVGL